MSMLHITAGRLTMPAATARIAILTTFVRRGLGMFGRFFDAMMASRQRQADHQIARHLAGRYVHEVYRQ
jgi:hypothetical protein